MGSIIPLALVSKKIRFTQARASYKVLLTCKFSSGLGYLTSDRGGNSHVAMQHVMTRLAQTSPVFLHHLLQFLLKFCLW